MRLAVYNVENLFSRAKAMNLSTWEEGKVILEKFAALNKILGKEVYTTTDKTRMVDFMIELGLLKKDEGPFVILRRNRGSLLRRPSEGGIEIVANGRGDWVGSLDLLFEAVDEQATRNTARVIAELESDVLAVVEAESRPALLAFCKELLNRLTDKPLERVMLIDGNDRRGIDVGLMTTSGYPIGMMASHVDDRQGNGEFIFSRDCPEYYVTTPSGQRIAILVNHLKSKGYGTAATSSAKRLSQSTRIKEIYEVLRAGGQEHIAIVGDFNDTPESQSLAPLLQQTDLRDVFAHPSFDDEGYPGTYALCNAGNKIDYILLSPSLYNSVSGAGVSRKGMWPGSRPKRWEPFAEVDSPKHAASDHAAVWVDLNL